MTKRISYRESPPGDAATPIARARFVLRAAEQDWNRVKRFKASSPFRQIAEVKLGAARAELERLEREEYGRQMATKRGEVESAS